MKRNIRLRLKENPVYNIIYHTLFEYPSPINLNYSWNFGSMALVVLVIQIITGIFLAMFYIPDVNLAFKSVEYIMREVNYGYLLRFMHSNGATMFFVVVYAHILRGLYYGSYMYPRQLLWMIGVFIKLLMIITAFMGYVLPWGQMSFWGATVITNLVSVVDIGHPRTFDFPVRYRTVSGASPRRVVVEREGARLAPFVAAVQAFERDGVAAITT